MCLLGVCVCRHQEEEEAGKAHIAAQGGRGVCGCGWSVCVCVCDENDDVDFCPPFLPDCCRLLLLLVTSPISVSLCDCVYVYVVVWHIDQMK